MHRIVASTLLLATAVSAFAPQQPPQQRSLHTPLQATKLAAMPSIPNPFQQLPWNVEKAQRSKERKLKLERSRLHRELGIAEDATYEEITEATDRMIAMADGDLKRKIQIEVVKDKILQIRLNERLAGLMSDIVTKDAKAQSGFETDGYVLHCIVLYWNRMITAKNLFVAACYRLFCSTHHHQSFSHIIHFEIIFLLFLIFFSLTKCAIDKIPVEFCSWLVFHPEKYPCHADYFRCETNHS